MPQARVAAAVGVTEQTVSEWENGHKTPSARSLIALADLFGVAIDELVVHEPDDDTAQDQGGLSRDRDAA